MSAPRAERAFAVADPGATPDEIAAISAAILLGRPSTARLRRSAQDDMVAWTLAMRNPDLSIDDIRARSARSR